MLVVHVDGLKARDMEETDEFANVEQGVGQGDGADNGRIMDKFELPEMQQRDVLLLVPQFTLVGSGYEMDFEFLECGARSEKRDTLWGGEILQVENAKVLQPPVSGQKFGSCADGKVSQARRRRAE